MQSQNGPRCYVDSQRTAARRVVIDRHVVERHRGRWLNCHLTIIENVQLPVRDRVSPAEVQGRLVIDFDDSTIIRDRLIGEIDDAAVGREDEAARLIGQRIARHHKNGSGAISAKCAGIDERLRIGHWIDGQSARCRFDRADRVADARKAGANFTFTGDGVLIRERGPRMIARQIDVRVT